MNQADAEDIHYLKHSVSFLTETDILPVQSPVPHPVPKPTPTEINVVVEEIKDDNTDLYSGFSSVMETESVSPSIVDYGTAKPWNPVAEWKPTIRPDIGRFSLSSLTNREPMRLDDDGEFHNPLRKQPNFEVQATSHLKQDITELIAQEPDTERKSTSTESIMNEEIAIPPSSEPYSDRSSTLQEIEQDIDLSKEVVVYDTPKHFCSYCLRLTAIPCVLPPRPLKSAQRYMHGLF
jgi:hypothetical protein